MKGLIIDLRSKTLSHFKEGQRYVLVQHNKKGMICPHHRKSQKLLLYQMKNIVFWYSDHDYSLEIFHRVTQQQSCDQFSNSDWLINSWIIYEMVVIYNYIITII